MSVFEDLEKFCNQFYPNAEVTYIRSIHHDILGFLGVCKLNDKVVYLIHTDFRVTFINRNFKELFNDNQKSEINKLFSNDLNAHESVYSIESTSINTITDAHKLELIMKFS